MRRFEFVEGTSQKFWAISLDDCSFSVTFGKLGTAGQTQVKSWPSQAVAQKEHDKLVAEKAKKGYKEVGAPPAVGSSVAVPITAPVLVAAPVTPPAPIAPPPMVTPPAPPTPPPPVGNAATPVIIAATSVVSPPPSRRDDGEGSVHSWTHGEAGEPDFPADFEIVKKAVLQMTDLKTNKNKYYAVELHQAGAERYRVFTHYGRTDDLDTNPHAGQRECRYLSSLHAAEREYFRIYSQKTGAGKGYKEVSLASSRIGSQKAIGTSSGAIDAKTLERIQGEGPPGGNEAKPRPQVELPPPEIQDLVRYIYSEATDALTSTVNAKITANGIETPLGILTVGQIEKGERILSELYAMFQQGASPDVLERYSGEFYSAIPHRLGRTRAAVAEAAIDSLADFEQKQETLQLMKDMLSVNGDGGNVLFDDEVGAQYKALGCKVFEVSPAERDKWAEFVGKSQVKSQKVKVKRVFQIRRDGEWDRFRADIPNQRMLFHGSRIKNWVGLLSRGILLPKIVVSMGVKRTDAGWLGNGIYFGDTACTASFYTTPGKRGTRFMAIARVALGKSKDYTKITYGLEGPPPGFDSCHGMRNKMFSSSQFEDDEYVVYELDRQRLEYLVEFTA